MYQHTGYQVSHCRLSLVYCSSRPLMPLLYCWAGRHRNGDPPDRLVLLSFFLLAVLFCLSNKPLEIKQETRHANLYLWERREICFLRIGGFPFGI
jgi:hypothetical protein